MLSTVLVVILILLLLSAVPFWGYSRAWGPWPGGIIGIVLVIVVLLVVSGRL